MKKHSKIIIFRCDTGIGWKATNSRCPSAMAELMSALAISLKKNTLTHK